VIGTTVGYAGGTTPDPTYRRMGDHSETVRVEFDPQRISYAELLQVFWEGHDPTAEPYLRQYRNAVLFTGDDQRRQAQESARRLAEATGRPVRTAIEAAGTFYPAEPYHQKYLLRGDEDLLAEYRAVYPDDARLVASTAVARVNGYLGCNGSPAEVERNLPRLGLSRPLQEHLVRHISSTCREFRGMTCPAPR
jgi:peptide-methionine (S)-S-oxide reductase